MEKFETEKRSLGRESNIVKPKIISTKLEIEEINKSSTGIDELEKKLLIKLESLTWQRDVSPSSDKDYFNKVFLDIAQLKENVLSLNRLSEDAQVYNFDDFKKHYEILKEDHFILATSSRNIIEEKKKKNDFLKNIEKNSSKIANLQKLSEWLNVDNISSLLGLDEKLNQTKSKYSKIESLVYNLPSNEEILKYSDETDNLLTYLNRLMTSSKNLEAKRTEYIKQLPELEDNVGKLNTYKNNLQEYSLKVLSMSSNKTNCPVCDTDFSENRLLELIGDITVEINNIDELKQLKESIAYIDKKIVENNKDTATINLLIKIGKEFFPTFDFEINTTKKIIQEVITFLGVFKELKSDIENLENLKKQFLSMGITEVEYTRFIYNYNDRYLNDFGELTHASIEIIKKKYVEKLLQKDIDLKKFNETIVKEENIIEKLRRKYLVDTTENHEFLEYLSERIKKLYDMKKEKENIESFVYLDDSEIEFIVRKILQLSVISKQLSELLIQHKKSSLVVRSLKEKLDVDENRDVIIDTNLNKLDEVLGLLRGLDSITDRLSDFFYENTQGILDVFMSIHAPKEFDGLSFNNGNITLKRIDSEEYDPITKISTGQKSALALSIFLTMNKNAQNAPKYILFDDPVSDIDDINILAFFDFLREISLSDERQIFFATASSKIANLFKKKFDFLGEDFIYNYLER